MLNLRTRYRRDAGRLALVLALLQAIVYAPFLFGDRALMMASHDVASLYPQGSLPAPLRDAPLTDVERTLDYSPGWQFEPDVAIERRLELKHLPMWNPYQGYGTPLAAAMQPQPFYPLTFLAGLVLNPITWNWFLVIRLFIAGLFSALYLRLFCSFLPSLAAGIAGMYTTYFGLYYDMPHLSVETLLPAFLWATELAVRRPSGLRSAVLAIVAALIIFGGMPESAALIYTIVIAYAAVRIVVQRTDGKSRQRVRTIATGLILGIAASSIIVLPFLEFSKVSFDVHQPKNLGGVFTGLGAQHCLPYCLLTQLVALANGPPWNNLRQGFSGNSGATGGFALVVLWLALIAILYAIEEGLRGRTSTSRVAVLFLALTTALLLAKSYGSPIIEWIGYLPIYRLIIYPKYVEAPVGTCMALLAGFGIARLQSRLRRPDVTIFADVLAVSIISFAWIVHRDEIPITAAHSQFFYGSISFALAGLCIVVAVRVLMLRRVVGSRRGSLIITACLTLAVVGNYVFPMLYLATTPQVADSPYEAPRFVQRIRTRLHDDHDRMMGIGHIFFGNWSGVFGLNDPTTVDAMYPDDLLQFLSAFEPTVVPPDLSVLHAPDVRSALGKRMLSLSSIEYVVAPKDYYLRNVVAESILDDVWNQNEPLVATAVPQQARLITEAIRGARETVLLEDPPESLSYQTAVTPALSRFTVDAGILPEAYEQHACAGAVRFRLSAYDLEGRELRNATRLLNPKTNTADRVWKHLSLDLTRAAGRQTIIRFTTEPGPSGLLCNTWAVWRKPAFGSARHRLLDYRPRPESSLTLESNDDAQIYHYSETLPRASIYHDVRLAGSDAAAVATLRSSDFDVFHTVVLKGATAATADAVHAGKGCRYGSAAITNEDSKRTTISASLSCAGLLMLNDTWYPGWVARIDGTPAAIFQTDELFRGVVVPAGRHVVTFTYEPLSVTLGVVVSAVASLAIAGLAFAGSFRRRLGAGR